MSKEIEQTLEFKGYFLEDNADKIPENVCGVYCAYACSFNAETNRWVGTDIVYFGKSGGDVRGRVSDHKKVDDNARKTLTRGEKLLYCYAETDRESECEKALVAAHDNLPRLANDKLTHGYDGPTIHLVISGDAYGMAKDIRFSKT